MVFHLPLRQTEGFLNSLMQLLDVDLPIPDHTTLSRRLQTLGEIGFQSATQGPLHLLIDSTGLRIHVGHLRKPPRNRVWRKLHLAVDAKSGQIVASALTNHRIRDSTPVPALLEQTDRRLASLCADGTYDRKSNGQAVRMAHPPDTQRTAEVRPVKSHEGEEQQRAHHPTTGPTRMAKAVRLQPAQHGGEHRLPIQRRSSAQTCGDDA
jgi:IS5 family transposase